MAGIAEDADAVVSGTPVMLYELLVLGDHERGRDRAVTRRSWRELIRGARADQPVAARTA